MEERVAGQDVGGVEQPAVEVTLLLGGDVQRVPDVGAATRRPQPGEPQLRVVPATQGEELVELVNVVAGHDGRHLEAGEACIGEVLHRRRGDVEGSGAADRVVGGSVGAVDRDLHVDVVGGGNARGGLAGDA